MNVVITGGTGFLGNALVHEFVRNGDKVIVITRPNSKRIKKIEGLINVTAIEIESDGTVSIPKDEYDVFYNLAWEGGRNDFFSQYANIDMTLYFLRVAAECGCKRFLCTGSQAEYGTTNKLITEETPIAPKTSYGAAKAAAYYLSRDLANKLGIEFMWVRVFSVYGENDNPNTLYSQLVMSLNKSQKFTLSTDGSHIWNYLHETDAARALRLLGMNGVNAGVYNLASGMSLPLCDYVEILRKRINPHSKIVFGKDVCKVALNVSTEKIKNEIGEYEKMLFPGF